jgi:hypothetical protein
MPLSLPWKAAGKRSTRASGVMQQSLSLEASRDWITLKQDYSWKKGTGLLTGRCGERKSFEPHSDFSAIGHRSLFHVEISPFLESSFLCFVALLLANQFFVRSIQLHSQDEEKGRRSRWREEPGQEALQELYFHLIFPHQAQC